VIERPRPKAADSSVLRALSPRTNGDRHDFEQQHGLVLRAFDRLPELTFFPSRFPKQAASLKLRPCNHPFPIGKGGCLIRGDGTGDALQR
jgi:hypothetical protein